MDDTHAELIRLRHAVIAMRDWIVPNLNAIEASIDQLLPKEIYQQPTQPYSAERLRALCRNRKSNKQRSKRTHG